MAFRFYWVKSTLWQWYLTNTRSYRVFFKLKAVATFLSPRRRRIFVFDTQAGLNFQIFIFFFGGFLLYLIPIQRYERANNKIGQKLLIDVVVCFLARRFQAFLFNQNLTACLGSRKSIYENLPCWTRGNKCIRLALLDYRKNFRRVFQILREH